MREALLERSWLQSSRSCTARDILVICCIKGKPEGGERMAVISVFILGGIRTWSRSCRIVICPATSLSGWTVTYSDRTSVECDSGRVHHPRCLPPITVSPLFVRLHAVGYYSHHTVAGRFPREHRSRVPCRAGRSCELSSPLRSLSRVHRSSPYHPALDTCRSWPAGTATFTVSVAIVDEMVTRLQKFDAPLTRRSGSRGSGDLNERWAPCGAYYTASGR